MLNRKSTAQRQDRDWFQFSASLIHGLCSDYIALRLLYHLEPLTTAFTITTKMLDVAEKSFKVLISVHTQTTTALSSAQKEYGHNVEKLRRACALYESVFDEVDVCAFAKDLNDRDGKLYQFLRYGSQETTDGFETKLAVLMPVVDKIFSNCIFHLPLGPRKVLFFCSPLKSLITGSRFDQTQNRAQLLAALQWKHFHFSEIAALCYQLDEEHALLLSELHGPGVSDGSTYTEAQQNDAAANRRASVPLTAG